MESVIPQIIDGLGGTTFVAKLLKLPVSTVHSWRKIGLTASRADHLRLAAQSISKAVDFETGEVTELVDEQVAA
ncbi:hypothetical protein [Sphingomonas sp. CFBP 13720]|uniref:hypothetical protein n=1 Tax=Sphingomonas sp. CFBP 13720 TaxID=2775302 RepID=UPI00177C4429|nr:hypothetical protein [Sphingomonas sp. CFBP 13720]MBD8677948.1 hypothetical protein [Sphingomonas sp. CFBP 13720]